MSNFTTCSLLSMIFPDDFNYRQGGSRDPLIILNGVPISGYWSKKCTGVFKVLENNYGSKKAIEVISNIQFITNGWLQINPFSIGLGDCVPARTDMDKVLENAVKEHFGKIAIHKMTATNEQMREAKIGQGLSDARNVTQGEALMQMNPDNNLGWTTMSGSKGDIFNITSIIGSLGQQQLKSGRVRKMLPGNRTLVHYPIDEKQLSNEEEIESRGYIKGSLIKGLSPQEFYFYCMAGRENITDTVMGTQNTGYSQRKLVKIMENLKVAHDDTVRDTDNSVVQFRYGDNSVAPEKVNYIKNKYQAVDIKSIVNILNGEVEVEVMMGDYKFMNLFESIFNGKFREQKELTQEDINEIKDEAVTILMMDDNDTDIDTLEKQVEDNMPAFMKKLIEDRGIHIVN